ncbi:MAG: phosphoribosyl-ATP diphosphatase [Phycisphaerales bacterium]|nr:phosphoribosyl-ATP diphosphatase [Phycisphaerales bacterium]
MIIPSIDLMNGAAVQLIGGREKAFDAGDPIPLAEKFRLAGEIAVIDLDAATGCGENSDVIHKLLRVGRCRVGGGIRTVDVALDWLDAGAEKIILGTAAVPDVLRHLPRDRVIAALDADSGEIMTHGWRQRTGRRVIDRMKELRDLVGGFLVTFIEREGRMTGIDRRRVSEIVGASGDARVTIAGGITTPGDIAWLDGLGADAQVGMALYSGRLDLADAIGAPLVSDRPDGLWPTVVADQHGQALGLAWSNRESLREAVRMCCGVYHSRQRGLWVKGASSGATQELLQIALDCDRDCLRFTVRQQGPGFCHLGTRTCWGRTGGISELAGRLRTVREIRPTSSYTCRLFDDPQLLRAKLIEEAGELADAIDRGHVISEAADLIYFTLVAATRGGASFPAIEAELNRRALAVRRRPGNAKCSRKECL